MAQVTVDKQILSKGQHIRTLPFPVKSGETILKDTFGVVAADGYLYEATSANVDASAIIGIIADQSDKAPLEGGPAATTADGSISGNRQERSAVAGDKTVRELYVEGLFLLTFTDTLTQANNGDKAYAINNFDCTVTSTDNRLIGTIVAVISSSQAWVDLNKAYA